MPSSLAPPPPGPGPGLAPPSQDPGLAWLASSELSPAPPSPAPPRPAEGQGRGLGRAGAVWSFIRDLRSCLGLSQDGFARSLGLTRQSIYRWERGGFPRGWAGLWRWCEAQDPESLLFCAEAALSRSGRRDAPFWRMILLWAAWRPEDAGGERGGGGREGAGRV